MVIFGQHQRCLRVREKGQGDDPCILRPVKCEYCRHPLGQFAQLSTPTYKLRRDSLENLTSATIRVLFDNKVLDQSSSSHSQSTDLSLPQPTFYKEIQEIDDKWSLRMTRLEVLIMLGRCRSQNHLSYWLIIHPQQVLSARTHFCYLLFLPNQPNLVTQLFHEE